ncbi:YegS/Rv2252/BmrU family lipid kinase [Lachnospiraceae bacterium JLR.KK008]
MSKNVLLIYNPCAGKGKIRGKLVDVIEILAEGGYEVTVRPTKGPGDAAEVVREKGKRYDLVVCSGGDGTLDEVVTGVMECAENIPIGYIPAGSTNDFAASLGLPKNMVEAAHIAVDGKKFSCDVGSFNQDIFVYVAAFGIFTEVSYETPQSYKNTLGHVAYILEGMKRLPSLRTYYLKVDCNGKEIEDEFLFGMITNSTSVGGFKKLTGKYVELNDGLFEVMLIRKPKTPLGLNQIITALLTETIDTDRIIYEKTDRITFQSEEEVAWTLDGEFGGDHTNVEIVNRPQAIEIMVPDYES